MDKVILFDLDGTLLPLEMDEFMHSYFSGVSKIFHEQGLPLKETTQAFMLGTQAMIDNDGSRTNEQAFWETFSSMVDHKHLDLISVFENFYQTEFQEFKKHTQLVEGLNEALINLKAQGTRLILATNPLFPKIATMSRIQWAGLDSSLFDEITTYEDYHYTKPNVEYYQEILNKFNLKPEQCFMVGNDAQEDLVIRELGIPTYLITDHLIDRSNGQYESEHSGTMDEFLAFITQS